MAGVHPNGNDIACPVPINERYLRRPWRPRYFEEGLQAATYIGDLPSPGINPQDRRARRDPGPLRLLPGLTEAQSRARHDHLASHASPYVTVRAPTNEPIIPDWIQNPGRRRQNIAKLLLDARLGGPPAGQANYRWEALRYHHFLRVARKPCMEGIFHPRHQNVRYGHPPASQWPGNLRFATEPCPHYHGASNVPHTYSGSIKPCVWRDFCRSLMLPRSRWHQIERAALETGATAPPRFRPMRLRLLPAIHPDDGHLVDCYWVCEKHVKANQVTHHTWKFIDAHRAGTCEYHRELYTEAYPLGFNSCTCEGAIGAWLCAEDYLALHRQIIGEFINRVTKAGPHGGVDRGWTGPPDPWNSTSRNALLYVHSTARHNGESFRQHIHRVHPCGLGCGRQRENQVLVQDCRACGGLIVMSTAERVAKTQKLLDIARPRGGKNKIIMEQLLSWMAENERREKIQEIQELAKNEIGPSPSPIAVQIFAQLPLSTPLLPFGGGKYADGVTPPAVGRPVIDLDALLRVEDEQIFTVPENFSNNDMFEEGMKSQVLGGTKRLLNEANLLDEQSPPSKKILVQKAVVASTPAYDHDAESSDETLESTHDELEDSVLLGRKRQSYGSSVEQASGAESSTRTSSETSPSSVDEILDSHSKKSRHAHPLSRRRPTGRWTTTTTELDDDLSSSLESSAPLLRVGYKRTRTTTTARDWNAELSRWTECMERQWAKAATVGRDQRVRLAALHGEWTDAGDAEGMRLMRANVKTERVLQDWQAEAARVNGSARAAAKQGSERRKQWRVQMDSLLADTKPIFRRLRKLEVKVREYERRKRRMR